MNQTRVKCSSCGALAWRPGTSVMFHASCPKRGGSKNHAPVYVPVEEEK